MRLFDSHCHLDAAEFAADRHAVVQRAEAAGVVAQLVPAVDRNSWSALRDVCASAPGLHAAYGLHPVFLAGHQRSHLAELRDWIERERPAAIGECGLDYFVEGLDRNFQSELLEGQLQLAREFDLPVVLHARQAVEDILHALRRIRGLRGVVHSFSGSEEQARRLFDLGFYIGIGGPVTYERAKRIRRVVSAMPLEFLLLETDAPDQPDADHRGQRNEPSRLTRVAATIASLRNCEPAQIAEATFVNALRLFRLPDPGPTHAD
ncbi:TatD family hydrolase [soil metagenome]